MSNRLMQTASFAPTVQPAPGLLLQRKCACGQHTVGGGTCSGCAKNKESLQRRTAGNETTTEIPPIVNEVLQSPGQPLDTATRAFMESRFHQDFSGVRIHADVTAAASAVAVNAHAYTVGSHIVFGAGQFVPATKAGKNLLAHELTHVLQQAHGVTRSASGIGPANDEHERQADAVAQAVAGTQSKPAAQTVRPLIPGTHQTVPASDGPPAPRRRLQRKNRTDDLFADSFEDGGIAEAAATETAEPTANCPKVPTKRGDDIPTPMCPTATHTGTTELLRFNFCLDSDELTNPEQLNVITATLRRLHRGTRYLIHGYASPEGRKDYNFRLACHRALKIAEAFRAALRRRLQTGQMDQMMLDAEVESRIETASQGPTSEFGKPESNRVAVVYGQIPGRDEPEPGCDQAPRKLGDIEPEINCDVSRTEFDPTSTGPQMAQFRFCLDSDVLKDGNPTDIRSFAHGQAANTNFIIHAFASVEGAPDYNRRLSCHRALRIFRELINAGTQEQQITEVSGLGETKLFGRKPEENRVAVVFAERGEVSEIPGGTRPAGTRAEKLAIRDAAVGRIMSGQYNLGADAYISFWTCGRTATVRQAVERLTIEVAEDNSNNPLRAVANGTEEGFGVNFVRVSNVALRADNALECVMGRIIDMSFHHAVLGNPDLPRDLTTPFDPRARSSESIANPKNTEARHQAGLHLIHLAGLSKCEGVRARVEGGFNPVGIDEPLVDDPREGMPAPFCADAPQPTRLHPPAAGAKEREAPIFEVVGTPEYTPFRGSLETNFESAGLRQTKGNLVTDPDRSILIPSATVQLKGQPETFKDYEVGFIQTVLDDETQADYDSGHSVIQKLPVPIRLAEMRGEPVVAPPWTTSNAMARPDTDGKVSVRATLAGLNTEVALLLRALNSGLANASMHEFNRETHIAIWLVARRLGAPLDRFSVRFLDGVTYSVIQNLALEHRRVKGELAQTSGPGLEERELPLFRGGFLTSQPSLMPEDPASARLLGPNANEIRVFNQVRNVVPPDAATETDMDREQLKRAVQNILDNIEIFEDEPMARLGIPEKIQPRLGFDYIPLTITMPFIRSTGRLENTDPNNKQIVIKITGPGLGFDAALSMARALEFRIRTRIAVNERIKVRPSIISGTGDIGDVVVKLDPLPRGPNADPKTESELIKRSDVRDNMAEAWACTEFLKDPEFLEVGEREFGRAFMMDRDKKITAVPSDRLEMGEKNERGAFQLFLPCLNPVDAVALGHFHTHPEVQVPPRPSEADFKYARDCGGQHFIVTDNKAFRYFGDGTVDENPTVLPKAPGCRKINLERLKIIT